MIKSLVVIGGPTASGKTRVGIDLAKRFKTEIISADSRQIYKETTIGTAVPSVEELAEIPHHFIQFLSLSEYYNASMYEDQVLKKLNELFKAKDLVLMVGGSGLYINAVCFGIDDIPTIDPEIRKTLALKYKKEGITSIQRELMKLDQLSYNKIDLNNSYRILKALEVTIQSGMPYSSFLTHQKRERNFRIIRIALNMDRNILYERINKRVENMIEAGLVAEVESLLDYKDKNALKSVGYREIFNYLENNATLDESIDLIKRNTRKYARKQLTWFRKDNLYKWFEPDEADKIFEYIKTTCL